MSETVTRSKRPRGGLWGSGRQVHPLSQTPIQPAPVPRTPFVQAQRIETGGNLTKLAQSLSGFNQSLNNLANVNAREKADPNSRDNREWIAKRQQMTVEELREEVKNNTPNGIRVREDALNLLLAEPAAAQFKRDFWQFYNTEFDKTSGDVETAFEQYRQQYAATLPSEIARGNFYQKTNQFRNEILDKDQEQKVAYTVQQLGSALTDSFRNTIEDALSQGKTPQEAATLVFSNGANWSDFMSLSPQDRDEAILSLAKEYALQGNETMVKALLETDRGSLGKALIHEDSKLAIAALSLIKQAGAIHAQEKQDKDWRDIAAFNKHVREGTLDDELAEYFNQSGSLSPARIGAGREQSDANREALLAKRQKSQTEQAALEHHHQERMAVVGAAYDALSDVNGIIRLQDVEIPNEKGTGTTTITKNQLVEEVVAIKEAAWEAAIAQADDQGQALAIVTQERIKWYASNNIPNKRWEGQLHGLAARATTMDLSKGGLLVDHVKSVAGLYRDLKSSNPAYLDTIMPDGKTREFLESYSEALELGMDEDTALLDASQMVARPDVEKRKVRLEPKARQQLVDDIAYSLGVDERSHHVIEKKIERLSERGATPDIIRDRLQKDLERTGFVHNGVLIFNHRDLPPDFLPLVNDILKNQHEQYKESYGLPDNVDDLYIERDSSGSHWVIRSKQLAGMIVGSQAITAQSLADQRQKTKENRLVQFRQFLTGARHAEKMRRDPDYHFEHETQRELEYWQEQLSSDKASWPSQIIQNNIDRLSDDLVAHQAGQLVTQGILPNSKQWNEWKAKHGRDVRDLEQLYRQHKE